MSEEKITGVCVDIPTIIENAKIDKIVDDLCSSGEILRSLGPGYRWVLTSPNILEMRPVWISVTEKMPEVGEDVMTFGDWGRQQGKYFPNYWELCGGDNLATPEQITHWMPLPEPPKHP